MAVSRQAGFNFQGILPGNFVGLIKLAMHAMYLRGRYRHVLQHGLTGHGIIAVFMIGRDMTLITKVDMN